MLTGSLHLIPAIECDIANYVEETRGVKLLGKLTGIVDGTSSVGTILSNVVISLLEKKLGWREIFYTMTGMLIISTLSSLRYLIFEIR
jgi:sugar phosphate permease